MTEALCVADGCGHVAESHVPTMFLALGSDSEATAICTECRAPIEALRTPDGRLDLTPAQVAIFHAGRHKFRDGSKAVTTEPDAAVEAARFRLFTHGALPEDDVTAFEAAVRADALHTAEARIAQLERVFRIVKYGAEMVGPEPYEFTASEVSDEIDAALRSEVQP